MHTIDNTRNAWVWAGAFAILASMPACQSRPHPRVADTAAPKAVYSVPNPPGADETFHVVHDAMLVPSSGRIALARTENGTLSNIPPDEMQAWLGFRSRHATLLRELAPIDVFTAGLADPQTQSAAQAQRSTCRNRPLAETLSTIQRVARGNHYDAIIVYEVAPSRQILSTEGSLLDLTLVGTFVRTRQSVLQVFASAAWVDAASGQTLATLSATAEDERSTALFGSETRLARQQSEARLTALEKLLRQMDAMLAHPATNHCSATRGTIGSARDDPPTADPAASNAPSDKSLRDLESGSSFWRAE